MTTTTKRTYKAFPYVDVLTDLLAGKGYDATAKKFGYYEPEKADSTKSFRAHLHRARNTGFKHENKTVRFPAFTRDGRPVFGKGRPSVFIQSLMTVEPAKAVKVMPKNKSVVVTTKVKPQTDSSIGVKLIGMKTRGRRPNPTNSVVMVVDSSGKFLTLSVPKSKSMIQIDSLLEALSPLISQGSSIGVPFVETPSVVENVIAAEQTHIEEQVHEESKTEPTVQVESKTEPATEQTHDLALAMATE